MRYPEESLSGPFNGDQAPTSSISVSERSKPNATGREVPNTRFAGQTGISAGGSRLGRPVRVARDGREPELGGVALRAWCGGVNLTR